MLDRILVLLDGSDASSAALAYAASLPAREIELLATIEEPDGLIQFLSPADREAWQGGPRERRFSFLRVRQQRLETWRRSAKRFSSAIQLSGSWTKVHPPI